MKTGLYLGDIPIGKIITEFNAVEGGINLQSKTITPSTSTQTVKPDSGYNGLSQVTVNPIPSNYKNTTVNNAPNPNQIENGYSAWANGEKIIGELTVADSLNLNKNNLNVSGNQLIISGNPSENTKTICNENTQIEISTPLSEFGNATTADVKSGVTFTSSNGLLIEGTLENNNNNNNMPSGIKAITSGTYTVGDTDITDSITIKTGLNEAPTFFMLKINETLDIKNSLGYIYVYENINVPYISKTGSVKAGTTFTRATSTSATASADFSLFTGTFENSSTDIVISVNASKKLKANASYSWVAVVME